MILFKIIFSSITIGSPGRNTFINDQPFDKTKSLASNQK